MTGDRAIRSIAIAGGGIVGLSAGIAFARALAGTQVTVVETTPDSAALADRFPTTHPGIARFHALIGLDELELVRSGIATHHLGTMFEGWSASEQPWVHAFGNFGKPAGAIPFDQIWVQAHRLGTALPYDRYAMGAALARAGKFAHPSADPDSVTSRFLYGLRLDPKRYRERLRAQAQTSGVAFEAGDIVNVERRDDGGIAALRLGEGTRIEADWFIDCAGPSATLIGAVDDSFEDWSAWMPFGKLTISAAASEGPPATADRVRASDDGWTIQWPLRDTTIVARATTAEGEVTIRPGRRLRPFVQNVLALGDAAIAMDPLHGMNLDSAQSAILLALELLPGRDLDALETGEYNRRAEQVTRRVRDFLMLHYLRSGRSDGIWAELSEQEPPDSLARTLDQYEYRGRMPFHEDETVTRDSWTAALIGLGLIPRNIDPQAAAVPLDGALPAMQRLAAEIEAAVARVPSYADYLAPMPR